MGSALACGTASVAQETDAPSEVLRFVVDDTRLIFDTTVPVDGVERDIRFSDVDEMRAVLRAHPQVTLLEINSAGGGHYSSVELAALVIDFGLDTHISQSCESSCVNVFLGGKKRTMAKGARMGFHQLSWSARAIEDYYTNNREKRGWDTPFDFGEWMYQDTQTEVYTRLSYMIERGVDPAFAVQTLRKPDAAMWYPYRMVLRAAGVLRD